MITSRNNPRIAAIRRLRSRKERDASGMFLAEGLRLTGEAVASRCQIDSCIVAADLLVSDFGRSCVSELQRRGVPLLEVSADVFATLSGREGPQGVAVVARQRWTALSDLGVGANDCWAVLDSVQDPGNLGTVLRTCDAAGGRGVILLDNTADPFDPTAVRASTGAIFWQVLVRASFAEFREWKDRHRVHLIAASDKAEADYRKLKYQRPLFLLMGSEREGLGEDRLTLAETVVRIPMRGHSDSLNLAVATALLLYEAYRQTHPVDSESGDSLGFSPT